MKEIQIGDKALIFRNDEDIMSAAVLEIVDILEVGPRENYAEFYVRRLINFTN